MKVHEYASQMGSMRHLLSDLTLPVLSVFRWAGFRVIQVSHCPPALPLAAGCVLLRPFSVVTALTRRPPPLLLTSPLPLPPLLSGTGFDAAMQRTFSSGAQLIEDLWLPFFCVSTNLTKGEPSVHTKVNTVTCCRRGATQVTQMGRGILVLDCRVDTEHDSPDTECTQITTAQGSVDGVCVVGLPPPNCSSRPTPPPPPLRAPCGA